MALHAARAGLSVNQHTRQVRQRSYADDAASPSTVAPLNKLAALVVPASISARVGDSLQSTGVKLVLSP